MKKSKTIRELEHKLQDQIDELDILNLSSLKINFSCLTNLNIKLTSDF